MSSSYRGESTWFFRIALFAIGLLIVVAVIALFYEVRRLEAFRSDCTQKGGVYYRPYNSDPICLKKGITL